MGVETKNPLIPFSEFLKKAIEDAEREEALREAEEKKREEHPKGDEDT